MKIVVCAKQVAMLGDEVEFTDDGRSVDPDYLEFALNEWDTFATEEALQIWERLGGEGEVVVVTAGDEEAEEAMRRCLAMGADRGVRIRLLLDEEVRTGVLSDMARCMTIASAAGETLLEVPFQDALGGSGLPH